MEEEEGEGLESVSTRMDDPLWRDGFPANSEFAILSEIRFTSVCPCPIPDDCSVRFRIPAGCEDSVSQPSVAVDSVDFAVAPRDPECGATDTRRVSKVMMHDQASLNLTFNSTAVLYTIAHSQLFTHIYAKIKNCESTCWTSLVMRS